MSDSEFAEMRRRIFQTRLLATAWQPPVKVENDSVALRCPHCGHVNEYKNFNRRTVFFELMTYCRSCRHRFFSASPSYRLYAWVVGHLIQNLALFNAYIRCDKLLRRTVHAIRRIRNSRGRSLLAAMAKPQSSVSAKATTSAN